MRSLILTSHGGPIQYGGRLITALGYGYTAFEPFTARVYPYLEFSSAGSQRTAVVCSSFEATTYTGGPLPLRTPIDFSSPRFRNCETLIDSSESHPRVDCWIAVTRPNVSLMQDIHVHEIGYSYWRIPSSEPPPFTSWTGHHWSDGDNWKSYNPYMIRYEPKFTYDTSRTYTGSFKTGISPDNYWYDAYINATTTWSSNTAGTDYIYLHPGYTKYLYMSGSNGVRLPNLETHSVLISGEIGVR